MISRRGGDPALHRLAHRPARRARRPGVPLAAVRATTGARRKFRNLTGPRAVPEDMRRIRLVVAAALPGCQAIGLRQVEREQAPRGPPPPGRPGEGSSRGARRRRAQARRCTSSPSTSTTQPGTVRSHLTWRWPPPADGQSEARHPPARAARRGGDRRGVVGERQADARRVRRAQRAEQHLHIDRHAPARSGAGDLGRTGLDRGVDLPAGEEPAAPLRARGVEPAAVVEGRIQYRVRSSRSATGSSAARRSRSTAAGWPARGELVASGPADPTGVHPACAGRSVPASDGARGGTAAAPHFVLAVETSRRDDARRSRAPARDAGGHAR